MQYLSDFLRYLKYYGGLQKYPNYIEPLNILTDLKILTRENDLVPLENTVEKILWYSDNKRKIYKITQQYEEIQRYKVNHDIAYHHLSPENAKNIVTNLKLLGIYHKIYGQWLSIELSNDVYGGGTNYLQLYIDQTETNQPPSELKIEKGKP